jgi:hypothetical protein
LPGRLDAPVSANVDPLRASACLGLYFAFMRNTSLPYRKLMRAPPLLSHPHGRMSAKGEPNRQKGAITMKTLFALVVAITAIAATPALADRAFGTSSQSAPMHEAGTYR